MSLESPVETPLDIGLTESEVLERRTSWGFNEIPVKPVRDEWFILLARQFRSSVVILLIVAALISYLFAEYLQSLAILGAVAINAFVGFFTELRAQISLKTLTKLSSPTIRTRRHGQEIDIPTRELVPGDIVQLEAGLRVPADVRLVQTCGINVDEATLTGESVPVFKCISHNNEEIDDIVYQGTLVLDGQALAIVIATALNSRIGKLGKLLTEVPSRQTPLELELEGLGKQLCWMMLILCVVLTLVGLWHQEPVLMMVQTSIALAVAAIPEGLPVVATLALAIGTQRMVKKAVLVRQLAAVEALGCCQVICSDKTGTLTENRMQVTEIFADGRQFHLSGKGYEPTGTIDLNGIEVDIESEDTLRNLLFAAALCNDAFLENHEGKDEWHIHGDPTEGALIVAAAKAGLIHAQLLSLYPRIDELSFDLTRKRMTTINRSPSGQLISSTKGSPESVLKICDSLYRDGELCKIDDALRNELMMANLKMAEKGLRVLAVARKDLSNIDSTDLASVESNLTFLGLVGMQDRPKLGVKESIALCKAAGIKILMLTGDQPQTALAIGKDLGIVEDGEDPILTGREISKFEEKELTSALKKKVILARVSPEVKLSVVRALQNDGLVVAMTGDGVNDAPALRQSDIGVAMGKVGSDLAREAAEIVITDDNFSSIVKAIEQGRVIYANIQNAIAYLLTASLAAVMTVAGAVLFNTGLPLLPLQLLWLNLIVHVFPALGVALLPSHKSIMKDKPRQSASSVLGKEEYIQIWTRALLVATGVLLAIVFHAHSAFHLEKITTLGFATLSCALLFQAWLWAWSGRSFTKDSIWKHVRPALVLNMLISYALMIAAIYIRPLEKVLGTTRLDFYDWLVVLSASLLSCLASMIVIKCIPRTKAHGKSSR